MGYLLAAGLVLTAPENVALDEAVELSAALVAIAAMALALDDKICWSVGSGDVLDNIAVDDCARLSEFLTIEAAVGDALEIAVIAPADPDPMVAALKTSDAATFCTCF